MEVGLLVVYGPNGNPYFAYDFDAKAKPSWKSYFSPDISKPKGFCEVKELIGEWTFVMGYKGDVNDVMYEPIKVTLLDRVLPNEEYKFYHVTTDNMGNDHVGLAKNVCLDDYSSIDMTPLIEERLKEEIP